jgi:predicted permease
MMQLRWMEKLRLRLRSVFHREDADYELSDELRDHIEQKTQLYVERGLSREEAHRQALLEFRGVERTKDECRDARGTRWLDDLAHDVRYALRMLRKNPGFAAIVILTLALGIGATSGVFSVVNGVLLEPLPYAHPEQLVALSESKPNFATGSIPWPNFVDWKRDNTTFSSMAISRPYSFTLSGRGEPERVQARLVTSEFFTVFGVQPAVGRAFLDGEDQRGAAPVVMISASLWQRKFGGDPRAVGRSLTLDDKSYTIIGVLPADFDLETRTFSAPDLYVPVGQWANPALTYRGAGLFFHGFGRLKAGVTIDQARADLGRISAGLANEYPDTNKDTAAYMDLLTDNMLGGVRPALLILLGSVAFVLLIACVNVGNLLLARSSVRAREIAIRATLGAGSSRLIRQLLTESVLLALTGGALGLLIAQWGTRAAIHLLPATLPRAAHVAVDGRVLAFTFAISVVGGILFGLAPAFKVAHSDLQRSLKDGGRTSTGGKQRLQAVFVVVEMAMGLVLLAGAGLMIRSLSAVWSINPGFVADQVLTASISYPPSLAQKSPEQIRQTLRDTEARFGAIPGVRAVSLVWGSFPLAEDDQELFWMQGHPKPTTDAEMNWATRYFVGPDYLKAMRIPLLAGRFFTPSDDDKAPLVVVVDEAFAKQCFGNRNPVGQRIELTEPEGEAEIVGLAGHVLEWSLLEDTPAVNAPPMRAEIYLPTMQVEAGVMRLVVPGANVVVRSDAPTANVLAAMRQASAEMNSEQVLSNVETMSDLVSDTIAQPRFTTMLLGGFALIALLLAMIGVYGVISYSVQRRTNEIGIRMALGAERGSVFRLVLGEGMRLAVIGAAVGIVAALALTRLLAGMLYGVSAHDPLTYGAVALVLGAVAAVACWLPAWRATRVDPMVALRYE